ncbi:Uncharacterized protein YpmB [Oceanobacillus limi]|uniref:Uncharacterized protein YpmB n=1 Tax=Oceanobacillus limi TaxID=930131 RepID=A0A1H9ZEQ5_9BACI|nr:DUF5590 domain-containing protein [Oceanobacillus limi]SES80065.1 Uncharacterized protein YpmB [Oceanobacillus limi]
MSSRYGYQENDRSSWLKWSLLCVIIIIISAVIFSVFVYQGTLKNKTEGYDETEKRVLEDTDMVEIHDVTRFHGEEYFHVVTGVTKDKEELLIFVPVLEDAQRNEEEYVILDKNEVMDKSKVKSELEQTCPDCKLINISPGIINNNPLWELTYMDHSNRYVIDYVSIYDGSQYERLRLREIYN